MMACRLADDAQGFDDQAPLIWCHIRNKPVFEALGANTDLGKNRYPFLGDREGNGASVAGTRSSSPACSSRAISVLGWWRCLCGPA